MSLPYPTQRHRQRYYLLGKFGDYTDYFVGNGVEWTKSAGQALRYHNRWGRDVERVGKQLGNLDWDRYGRFAGHGVDWAGKGFYRWKNVPLGNVKDINISGGFDRTIGFGVGALWTGLNLDIPGMGYSVADITGFKDLTKYDMSRPEFWYLLGGKTAGVVIGGMIGGSIAGPKGIGIGASVGGRVGGDLALHVGKPFVDKVGDTFHDAYVDDDYIPKKAENAVKFVLGDGKSPPPWMKRGGGGNLNRKDVLKAAQVKYYKKVDTRESDRWNG